MPPRRAPKVGLKRIDAALDALRPMGFSPDLIRKTVQSLLKAYGGDEGWPFLEENSYRLVIESILEELEKPEREDDGPKMLENGSSKDEIIEEKAKAQVHYPSDHYKRVQSPSIESPPQKKHAMVVHTPSINTTPGANAVPCSLKGETSQVKLERKLPSSEISAGVSSPQLFSPPPVESRPAQRRKPCYGWLSSDDEEEPDLVNLVSATSRPP
ncbi:uncharacterized protein LOC8270455 [Ricinus communis]|uniref:WIYLD domain-containing protein n=1 Tax=Ricinus communis TaxID=3988 RepID=B9SLL2_RICCO|nr:uncharacterized protein LOC8270455 [Ricinus communis]XP_048231331.1 uncharacterized protein LOC8270455 [Ricinus communis]EEF35512.1 conserved hypothetical protein [Ricinus communis]|eukprot:XP_002526881.1 uncharacterized protein LOC8270455 [Ricinus communis]